MKNWEDMVEYYKNNSTARYNILKNAGRLTTEMEEDLKKEMNNKEEENTDK